MSFDRGNPSGEINIPGLTQETADRDSIFFVSLPKSGTVYTWTMLERVTGLSMPRFHELQGWRDYSAGLDFACPHLYACGDYNTQLLRPDTMKYYLKGFVFGAHMQASFHNMEVLKVNNIERISVLLRDPRDALVSWVHHLRKLGPSSRNYHSKIYNLAPAYYDWSLPEQVAYQIRTFLPTIVNWVEGWLHQFAVADGGIEILFVYFDELKRAPKRYLQRILQFHGIDGADLSAVSVPEVGQLHFRKGQHGQWREEFSAHDQALAADLMQGRLQAAFTAAAAAHPANRAASEALKMGRFRDAAAAAFEVVQQYSNDKAAYETFALVCDKAGSNTVLLRDLVSRILSDAVEEQFIVRDELISICESLLSTLEEEQLNLKLAEDKTQ